MSYTFVTAARIRMPESSYREWLDTPVPTASIIENKADMFGGWCWDGRDCPDDWSTSETDWTPRRLLTARAAGADGETFTVVRHRDGALEAYFWTVGEHVVWEFAARRLLLTLAGAARFTGDDGGGHVLFWEDTAGVLPDADNLLALLAVDGGAARFAGPCPLDEVLAALAPVEEAFGELAEAFDEDEEQPAALLSW
ncbi:hypothetical protein [Actinoplanes sp. NBRC 101535]|uniref:hypothetical protein n=1 Tax=Actinoplanes sp. NBRC 101535 TaxID=3032196 RepID=UPI0024A41D47|nr:hypothetical protein [Actinoplanes sp. NBRC 101535]GLY00239.1 hypothetical protein Acsp01_06180 [Actinoplanes sp. NBRC 101535]